jgi:phosphonopyruvate decarboxylase
MGRITGQLFETMAIPWEFFPNQSSEIPAALQRANQYFEQQQRPYALVMRKGTIAHQALEKRQNPARARATSIVGDPFQPGVAVAWPSRESALETIIAATPEQDCVVIATTGFTGRELFAVADRANHFYMVGSMGCASSLGVGLAMARPDLQVVVIDGDGAALMRMGNMATLGAYADDNLTHILLDNEAHDSTGAQPSVSASVDFAAIAVACGYGDVHRGLDIASLENFLRTKACSGPRFLHLKIKTGTIDNLPRPSITPTAVLQRLKQHIKKL